MKKLTFTLAALSTLLAGVAYAASTDKLEALSARFSNPDKQYRTAPFFVWNYVVTNAEIDRMLTELKARGCGGVFIHPRMGLVTEYLSQEWFDRVRYTVKRCRELDMEVWLYDENSYPSGFAGGHTAREMPESWNQGQGLQPQVVAKLPADASEAFIVLMQEGGQMKEITTSVGDYAGKPGKYFLYRKTFYQPSPWKAGGTYVDLMARGVTEKFMEITMSGYAKNFGADLKRTFKGIFTDEPEIQAPTSQSIRWTPDLFAVFAADHGYDLRPNLPSLHTETGEWKKVRHNYMQTILKLFIDRWAKPWYEYCQQKGLAWTGHYWEHTWPNPGRGPDNMAMAAWQQYPGIDMLFNQFNEQDVVQFGNIRAVKEVSSVANQLGRERVLSETYGGAGWSATFRDFKRLNDWQMAVGVNFVNQHFSPQSIIGIRKFDYPPFFSPAASWWEDYRVLNDYCARMSAALSMGSEQNEILVLEPTTTAWLYGAFQSTKPGGPHETLKASFHALLRTLKTRMVEYDLGCEDIFKTYGSVSGSRFTVGQRAYRLVVIPPLTENLETRTMDLLEQFVAGGGQVIAFSTPGLVNGSPSERPAKLFSSPKVVQEKELTSKIADKYMRNDQVVFHGVSGGSLYHQRREFADGQLLLLVNSSLEHAATVDVSLSGSYLTQMEALDGKIYTIPFTTAGGKVRTTIRLEPAGSAILQATHAKVTAENPFVMQGGEELRTAKPMEIKRMKDNILVVDYMDLQVGDTTFEEIYYGEATHKVFTPEGFPGNPWYRSIQYRTEVVDKDLSASKGFTATYRFTVEKGVDLPSVKLLIERSELFTVKLNGRTVAAALDNWLIDPGMRIIPVGTLVKEGENTVELYTPKTTVHSELGAIFVLGDFGVQIRGETWVITSANTIKATGSWRMQGAPFYPWEVAYAKMYHVPQESGRYYVKVEDFQGMLAQIWVNGKKAGIVFAEPWALDVSGYVKKGPNRIEVRIVGGMDNLLGPHHAPHTGLNSPKDWENITVKKAAGQYVLSDYGLEGDFGLFAVKK